MRTTILAVLGAILLALPAMAQDQQAAPQRGGCASGFCSMSNAPAQDAGAESDIDAVEADMKRQLSGQRQPRQQMAGMMGMCPCMRMMSMMMQGRGMQGMGMGMGGMNMPHMNMPSMNMQDMPGMSPMPGKAPPKTE